MINVSAIQMQQFGVRFYQASLTAQDIDKLVRFEVLSYGEQHHPPVRGRKGGGAVSKVNWNLLERRIAANEKAYQRQIIRRKIDELVGYYEQCRQARDLPSIPGAVIISCDEKLSFSPVEEGSNLGILKVPEREGVLRAIDGQHRLLAMHADIERFGQDAFTVPAVIFDQLAEDHIVQMFVTINAKHTRLNSSHLVSLSGRQLYRDPSLASAHDIVRVLNDRDDSPLYHEHQAAGRREGQRRPGAPGAGAETAVPVGRVRRRPQDRELPRRGDALLRELLQADRAGVWRGLERAQVQHQVVDRAQGVHPGGTGRGSTPRRGARGAHRLPGHRPRHRAVGPPHRRPAVRDRWARGARARRWRPWRRSCASRCTTPKGRWANPFRESRPGTADRARRRGAGTRRGRRSR